jgi:hypothetical protein
MACNISLSLAVSVCFFGACPQALVMNAKTLKIIIAFFIWLNVFVSIRLALSRIAYNVPAAWRCGGV